MTSEELALIEAALARRAHSRDEVKELLRQWETIRSEFAAEQSVLALKAVDLFTLMWMARNRGYVSVAEFDRALIRVETHEPRGRQQRLFDLSPLGDVSRFVRVFRRHPAGILEPLSRHRRLRPLVEIEMRDELPRGITACGIRSGDRLVVHIGSEMYDGALAILSMDVPPPVPKRLTSPILIAGRILSSETDDDRFPQFRGVRLRIHQDNPEGIEIDPGEARVECVVFGRGDLLIDSQSN
jgi:hypothetical protein